MGRDTEATISIPIRTARAVALARRKPAEGDAKVGPMDATTTEEAGQGAVPEVARLARRPVRAAAGAALEARAPPIGRPRRLDSRT